MGDASAGVVGAYLSVLSQSDSRRFVRKEHHLRADSVKDAVRAAPHRQLRARGRTCDRHASPRPIPVEGCVHTTTDYATASDQNDLRAGARGRSFLDRVRTDPDPVPSLVLDCREAEMHLGVGTRSAGLDHSAQYTSGRGSDFKHGVSIRDNGAGQYRSKDPARQMNVCVDGIRERNGNGRIPQHGYIGRGVLHFLGSRHTGLLDGCVPVAAGGNEENQRQQWKHADHVQCVISVLATITLLPEA